MGREDVLALETRRRIFQTIDQQPGIHLRGLARATGIPLSTLRYHVRYMEEHGVITARVERQYKRYFPAGGTAQTERRTLSLLRREKPRRILLGVLERDAAAWYAELRAATGYPASTLGLYLSELVASGLLERECVGRTSRYRIVDPDGLIRLLIEYRESFYDRWVDRVIEIVEEGGRWGDGSDRGQGRGRP